MKGWAWEGKVPEALRSWEAALPPFSAPCVHFFIMEVTWEQAPRMGGTCRSEPLILGTSGQGSPCQLPCLISGHS